MIPLFPIKRAILFGKPCTARRREQSDFSAEKYACFPKRRASGGFTLVELLVSIGIFTMVTTLAVVNNGRFNSSVLLTNLAYEIGLSVRQAQFYGITVKGTTADPNKFDSGYGIRFDLSTPAMFVLYEDVKPIAGFPNHIKDAGDVDLETFRIQKGNQISKICVRNNCLSSGDFENIVDITFIRPNPDAFITSNNVTGTYHNKAEICVLSPQGTKRRIIVESTGQISVTADAAICN